MAPPFGATSVSRTSRRAVALATAALVLVLVLTTMLAGCSPESGTGASPSGTNRLPARNRGSRPPATASDGSALATGRLNLDDVRVQLTPVAELDQPVALTRRQSTSTLYVAEKAGRVRAIQVAPGTDENGNPSIVYSVETCCVLDISGEVDANGERGLLGLAFSTDGRKLYAYFTSRDGSIHIIEHQMEGDRTQANTRRELLSLPHPRPNHNGGQLEVGPDGFLYIGVGDGGGSGDPDGNGQNPHTLYGKILRIDPEGSAAQPYSVPPDNPYAPGSPDESFGRPEVWLYGARNPWRFSFDRATADLWVGDVGQNRVEEVDLLRSDGSGAGAGANLGWNLMEGSRRFTGSESPPGHVPPVFEYTHEGGGCGVIGGYVYRGANLPDLAGTYFYGDTCLGRIDGLLTRDGAVLDQAELGAQVPENTLASFGQDNDGELYVLSLGGEVYRIDPA